MENPLCRDVVLEDVCHSKLRVRQIQSRPCSVGKAGGFFALSLCTVGAIDPPNSMLASGYGRSDRAFINIAVWLIGRGPAGRRDASHRFMKMRGLVIKPRPRHLRLAEETDTRSSTII